MNWIFCKLSPRFPQRRNEFFLVFSIRTTLFQERSAEDDGDFGGMASTFRIWTTGSFFLVLEFSGIDIYRGYDQYVLRILDKGRTYNAKLVRRHLFESELRDEERSLISELRQSRPGLGPRCWCFRRRWASFISLVTMFIFVVRWDERLTARINFPASPLSTRSAKRILLSIFGPQDPIACAPFTGAVASITSFNGFARMQESVFPTSEAETAPHASFSDKEDH